MNTMQTKFKIFKYYKIQNKKYSGTSPPFCHKKPKEKEKLKMFRKTKLKNIIKLEKLFQQLEQKKK